MRNRKVMPLDQAIATFFGNSVPEITPASIKARYRELVKTAHPDKGGDAQKFNTIKEAYEALMGNVAAAAKMRPTNTGEPTMGDSFVDFVTGKGSSHTRTYNAYGKQTSPLYEVTQYANKLGVTLSVTMQADAFVVTHIADIKLETPIVLGKTVDEAKASVDAIADSQKRHQAGFKGRQA